MVSVVIDTSAYSIIRRGDADFAAAIVDSDQVIFPSATVAELKLGFIQGSKRINNEKELQRILDSDKVSVVYPDSSVVDYYVLVAAFARKKGVALSHNDIWIAAHALDSDAELVTYDNDFLHLDYPDLKIWNKKSR